MLGKTCLARGLWQLRQSGTAIFVLSGMEQKVIMPSPRRQACGQQQRQAEETINSKQPKGWLPLSPWLWPGRGLHARNGCQKYFQETQPRQQQQQRHSSGTAAAKATVERPCIDTNSCPCTWHMQTNVILKLKTRSSRTQQLGRHCRP